MIKRHLELNAMLHSSQGARQINLINKKHKRPRVFVKQNKGTQIKCMAVSRH